ncbi:MAG TPA: serine/threonine-protein kinase [Polyangia bacterium]|jgi:serine/threonine protein kinase|nr:serine/threonine-protein kinase [Polyangia bacterium]
MAMDPSPLSKLSPGSPAEPTPFGSKYLLVGLIARGGMAEVYRARMRSGGERLLAIKCMRPQLAKEMRFVEMFKREGNLAMLLQHDAIVRTYEVGQVEGRYFIAMEYISGKDLTQILRRCQESGQRIPVPHAIYIAARIAEGLHYAHVRTDNEGRALNIVNRDVSPSNVRVSYDGQIKLLDFGIAQALVKFTSEIGVLKGKFSYMSPEQIRGMPLDARTDVFSTGIILHEMLTTEKLFRGDTEFALMEKVRKADVTPPSKFNRRVTEKLDQVASKALARDVGDRYQTGQELADDLYALLENYRFQPQELEEFVRGLFRQDYTREQEEVDRCMHTQVPPDEEGSASSLEMIIEPSQPGGMEGPGTQPGLILPETETDEEDTPPDPEPAAARPGLWARIKGRLSSK